MANTQLYEKIVKKKSPKQTVKIVFSIIFYVLFFLGWLLLGLLNPPNALFIFTLGALLTLVVVIITWKYLFVEFEYTFCMSSLTIAKIYGKRKRKVLIEFDVSKSVIIAPATEENINKAEKLEPQKRIIAVSNESAPDIWLLLCTDAEDEQHLIFIESDARIASILRTVAPHVISKRF